jgi:hypothetical protein
MKLMPIAVLILAAAMASCNANSDKRSDTNPAEMNESPDNTTPADETKQDTTSVQGGASRGDSIK